MGESNNGGESRSFNSNSSYGQDFSSESRSSESRYDETPRSNIIPSTDSNKELKKRLEELREELALKKQIAAIEKEITEIDGKGPKTK